MRRARPVRCGLLVWRYEHAGLANREIVHHCSTVSSAASPVRPGAKVGGTMGREVGAVLDLVMRRP